MAAAGRELAVQRARGRGRRAVGVVEGRQLAARVEREQAREVAVRLVRRGRRAAADGDGVLAEHPLGVGDGAAAVGQGREEPRREGLRRRLGSKRVIQRSFNVSVPRARVSETAPTLRERSER